MISPSFVMTRYGFLQNVTIDQSCCYDNRIMNIKPGGNECGNLLIKGIEHTIRGRHEPLLDYGDIDFNATLRIEIGDFDQDDRR